MKRFWKLLNWKLPAFFGCLLEILLLSLLAGGFMALVVVPTIKRLANAESVATVDKAPITKRDLREKLRARLWCRGESWEMLDEESRKTCRAEALESLIADRLIAQFPALRPIDSPSIRRESENEFQQFLKQFPPPDEWKQRMELQGLNEVTLRHQISGEVRHLDAIERWLAEQPGKIAEFDARAWFASHQDELVIPERVRASHIFLTRHDKDKPDREPEIRELHRKLTSGEAKFAELAATHSDDESAKRRGGDLGWFSRDRVPTEFADKAFSQAVGEIGEPFQSHLGWHILLVGEKMPQRHANYDEMKEEIVAMLDFHWREAAVQHLLTELRGRAKVQWFPDKIQAVAPE
ncbi:MAG TPA: peptidylprolyl isomerase [Verrucomicrobiaceae bacterium]